MELSDQQKINAPREQVFQALNDPDILGQCIPGCESLSKVSDTEMAATIVLRMGPVKAKFSGTVTLSNINPPNSYTIIGEGKGGAAGFAKGGADIELQEEADGSTNLKYDVKVDIGGKIAQLGSRLMISTSRKLAEQFFEKFAVLLETQNTGNVHEASDCGDRRKQPNEISERIEAKGGQVRKLIPVLVLVCAALLAWYFLSV